MMALPWTVHTEPSKVPCVRSRKTPILVGRFKKSCFFVIFFVLFCFVFFFGGGQLKKVTHQSRVKLSPLEKEPLQLYIIRKKERNYGGSVMLGTALLPWLLKTV